MKLSYCNKYECDMCWQEKVPVETIAQAFDYFVLSKTAYNQLREDLQLASLPTSKQLTSKVTVLDDYVHLPNNFGNPSNCHQKLPCCC